MFGKGRTRKTFGQRISNILRTFTFQQLDVAITHELPQIRHSSVNMPRALGFSLIMIRGIILFLKVQFPFIANQSPYISRRFSHEINGP